MKDVTESIFGPNGVLAQNIAGYEPRKTQLDISSIIEKALDTEQHAFVEGPCGCHVAGQEILMYDGSIKIVEDVLVGDQLMGPDGTPRNVLALARGQQETVVIEPTKGQAWEVNLDHILTLVSYNNGHVSDISVRNWFDLSKTQKSLNKLFRVPVASFGCETPTLPLSSYFVGMMLGDGGLSHDTAVVVTKPDPEIEAACLEEATRFGLEVRQIIEQDTLKGYRIVGQMYNKSNHILNELRGLQLMPIKSENRFIPKQYMTASWDDRRHLLAGLVDTDGNLTKDNCTYDWISKSETLANNVAFVARSLGLAAYVNLCTKSYNGKSGTYYRVCISGDTSIIPCRIPRKKASARKQIKSVLRTGFTPSKTGVVKPYFGFSLDGDCRYLLGDFTVTHNTGKSFAYIVPSSYHASSQKKKVVIATANIALQEQLVKKDLPAMAEVLPWDFSFALLKGLNNYVCKAKVGGISNRDLFSDHVALSQFADIMAWAETTETGDMSELPFVPLPQVWSRASTMTDECAGSDCGLYNSCFGVAAKRKSAEVDVIVTNYHMLFAHFAVQEASDGMAFVLPDFDILIMDEAHEASEIARDFFGFRLTDRGIAQLATMVSKNVDDKLGKRLSNEAINFFAGVAGYAKNPAYKIRIKKYNFIEASDILDTLRLVVKKAKSEVDGMTDVAMGVSDADKAKVKILSNIMQRARKAGENIQSVLALNEEFVYWIEAEDGRTAILSKMIDPGPVLGKHLFHNDKIKTTIAVSATMTTGAPTSKDAFDFVRREIGAMEITPLTYVGDSPFDFKRQALVVIPEMPAPNDAAFTDAAAQATRNVITTIGGKTLGLYTSYKNLNAAFNAVKNSGFRILKQGDLPRPELTRIFREDLTSCLLGTDSFWTGVDVQGEALTGLVIDRLPFTNPSDPVCDAISERDKNAFMKYHVPNAVIKFRQGVGRLIRTRTDIGVIVVLDNRIIKTNWGKGFFWSSMPAGISAVQNLNQVGPFLAWARSNVWMSDVYDHVKNGRLESAVDSVRNNMTTLISSKSYAVINGVLGQIDFAQAHPDVITEILTMTKPFASYIDGRVSFEAKARQYLS